MRRTDTLSVILLTVALAGCARPETPSADEAPPATRGETVATAPAPVAGETLSHEQLLSERMLGYGASALDGSTYRIADQKGKVLLVNAWATWCGPCRYEIPELKRLHEEYGDDGLEIVGVSVDMAGAESAVREFVRINRTRSPA
jgi:thiol-disulfide isomerase/thioredoxin